MGRLFSADAVATFLSQTPLLRDCPLDELFALAEAADQKQYDGGSAIVPPGRPVAALGLLLRGRAALRVVDASTGAATQVGQVLPGEPFGEVGLLLGSGNPVAVFAEDDAQAVLIGKTEVDRLLATHPQISLALAKRISRHFVQVSVLGSARVVDAPSPPASPAPSRAHISDRSDTIPFVEVADFNVGRETLALVPSALIRRHRLLPLEVRTKELVVGMVNPRSAEALADLRRVLHSLDPKPVAISIDDFNQTIVRLKLDANETRGGKARHARNQRVEYAADQKKHQEKAQLVIGDEAVMLFDRILLEALDLSASDIHIEPNQTGVQVRYRVQGSMVERQEFIAPSFAAPLLARIKVVAELDITERRLPQDGRIVAQVGRQEVNLRVATMAVIRGEKAVIRIIDPADVMRPLHQIFLLPEVAKAIRHALIQPYGAIIVAGPTGSGKSSTLYSMLHERRAERPDANMVTVEDPVEYLLPGVTQVPVRQRVGLNFSAVLHGLMRQDPDLIMIGELREAETAQIMIEAALTGHLVLTSTHGNDAPSVIQRLQHFGVDPALMSQGLAAIVVQRLARRLCGNCVKQDVVAPALLQNLVARRIVNAEATVKLPRPIGCEACKQTGYSGRVALHEILIVDDGIRAALAEGMAPTDLVTLAQQRECIMSFAQSATHMLARNLVSPSDALLVVAD